MDQLSSGSAPEVALVKLAAIRRLAVLWPLAGNLGKPGQPVGAALVGLAAPRGGLVGFLPAVWRRLLVGSGGLLMEWEAPVALGLLLVQGTAVVARPLIAVVAVAVLGQAVRQLAMGLPAVAGLGV